jgi:hypothetical protein
MSKVGLKSGIGPLTFGVIESSSRQKLKSLPFLRLQPLRFFDSFPSFPFFPVFYPSHAVNSGHKLATSRKMGHRLFIANQSYV